MMKQLSLVLIVLLFAGTLSGQALHTGTVIECNEIAVELHPGKSLDEYVNIMVNQMGPAIERLYPGTEVYFVKGNRGNAEAKVGAIWAFESAEVRNRYFDAHGNPTPEEQSAREQLAPIVAQLDKIGKGTRYSMVWEVINEPRSGAVEDYYAYLIAYCSGDNHLEVPIAPATLGISDPRLEKLVREISETTGSLIESGSKEGDPLYEQYTSRIKSSKKSLKEVAILLAEEESRVFQKGGSFGYHKLTASLADGVTMEQYLNFWTDEYFPEFEKLMKGMEVLIMVPFGEPLRDQFVYVYYFRSESKRDQYWPEPDNPSNKYNQAKEKMKPLFFELLELGTWEDDYGVWIIQ